MTTNYNTPSTKLWLHINLATRLMILQFATTQPFNANKSTATCKGSLGMCPLNPICTGDFGSYMTRGGADLPPPSKMGCNGWDVQKLSWNLISYQDWCQTWGFTTFRYLEPPQLMVWKSDFFRRSLRFVRVPPYESGVKLTNFYFSWVNGAILLSGKCCPPFHTKN